MTDTVATFTELLERARSLAQREGRAVLGIVGSPGAGKTTLARSLVTALAASPPPGASPDWVAHVPMDGYHLADVELDRLGLRQSKGAPDTFDGYGFAALLARLRAGGAADEIVYAPTFERDIEQPLAGAIPVFPETRLVISEGNYLLRPDGPWPAVRRQCDEVWYTDIDESTRLERLLARHVRFGKPVEVARAWIEATDEPNARLIEATRDAADLWVAAEATQPTR